MKKTAIARRGYGRRAAPDDWRDALRLLDADLRRRGAAEKTRRAYGIDAAAVRRLGDARTALDRRRRRRPRALRRYAAHAHRERGAAPQPPSRASSPRCARSSARCASTATSTQNPADLVAAPSAGSHLPRVLRPDEIAALLDRIPAATPLELRDRALFELAYACGLRAEELVKLDTDVASTSTARSCASRARAARPGSFPPASPRCRRSRATSSAAARAPRRGRGRAGAVPLEVRPPAVDLGRPPPAARLGAATPRCRAGSPRMRCATRSRRTCWTAARTCARSRSCSGTAAISTTQIYTRVESARLLGRLRGAAIRGPRRRDDMETNVKAIELKDLWRRYKTDGDERARERLVVAYSPLVKYVAGRMALRPARACRGGRPHLLRPRRPDLRDRALRARSARSSSRPTRSRASRARSSTSCARWTGCRARCAPGPARSSARNSKLEHKLQRAPTDEEMAAELEMDVEDFQDALLQISNSLDRRARRAVDGLRLERRPGLAARHDRRTPRARPGGGARPDRPARTASPTRSRACPSARSS